MRKIVLFIAIFLFSACAGKMPNPEIAVLKKKIKQLEARAAKNNHNIIGLFMQLRMQEKWNAEAVGWLKYFAEQNDDLRYGLIKMEAGYAQLNKDMGALWNKVFRLHKLKKKRPKKSAPKKEAGQ